MLSFEDNDDDGCDSISKGSGSSSSISRRKRPYLPGSQCRAWRFQLMVRANLCNASTAVERQTLLLQHLSLRTGHNMPDCVTGVVVFCDASLFSQPPGSDGLVSIEMLGYVQARHATRLSTLNKWVDSVQFSLEQNTTLFHEEPRIFLGVYGSNNLSIGIGIPARSSFRNRCSIFRKILLISFREARFDLYITEHRTKALQFGHRPGDDGHRRHVSGMVDTRCRNVVHSFCPKGRYDQKY